MGMKRKVLAGLFVLGIVLSSGCVDNTKQYRLHTIALVDHLNHRYDLNENVDIAVGFYEGDIKNKMLVPVSDAKIDVTVIDPKGSEFDVSVLEDKNKSLEPLNIRNIENYERLKRYRAKFSKTTEEGTYIILVDATTNGFSSKATEHFVVGEKSKLVLNLNAKSHKFTPAEKKKLHEGVEKVKLLTGKEGFNVTIGKIEGAVLIVAEIGTDTGATPIIKYPEFIGEMILPNGTVKKISGFDPTWEHIEEKNNKQYLKHQYLLPLEGRYKVTFSVKSSFYEESENVSIDFVLE